MSSVVLQNSVRLRIFLILVLSIAIRLLRPMTSTSVHKATTLLEMNYFLYAVVILCTLLPLKASWMLSIGALGVASIIDGLVFVLTVVATLRCLSGSQIGCIHHSIVDVSTIALVGFICILDLMQTWAAYRILRIPNFVASATQRIRVVFSWSWPFAWMVNITLWSASQWSIWTLPHLMLDPVIIVLASTKEIGVLVGIMGILIITDVIAWLQTHMTLATWGIIASGALTCVALLIVLTTVESTAVVDAQEVTPVVTEVPKRSTLRRRTNKKSGQQKILF